jgi:hypothetical protein
VCPFSGGSKQLDAIALRLPGIEASRARGSYGFCLLGGGLAAGSGISTGNLGAGTFGSARGGFLLGSLFLPLFFVLRILLRLSSVCRNAENISQVFLCQGVKLKEEVLKKLEQFKDKK